MPVGAAESRQLAPLAAAIRRPAAGLRRNPSFLDPRLALETFVEPAVTGLDRRKARFAPFNRLQATDPATRGTLARVVAATTAAGHAAFVMINNKAEGSAPLSVIELAKAIAHQKRQSP